MKITRWNVPRVFVSVLGVFSLIQCLSVQALPYAYTGRDLIMTFRANGGTEEVLVNLGQATSYSTLAPGTVITVNQFTYAQLTTVATGLKNLSWSAGACVKLADVLPNYPNNTLWVTAARASANVQSTPYTRVSSGSAQNVTGKIASIGNNGVSYSGTVSSNQYNTSTSVQIPAGNALAPTANLGANADYSGQFQADTENTTPSNFNTSQRLDLYEMTPTGTVDAHTGQTSGPAAYLGYFELATNGVMTFTAAGGTAPPPPAPVLTLVRSNNANFIMFNTTNNATYTLHYTNSAGLNTAASNWPAFTTNVTGNGGTRFFQDSANVTNRFYRVGAQ